ncbi:MAG TPA: hypothetical protein VGQ60_01220, partial [Nitrospiraceae bacterium]|nr:hypothetical protein [Nitrospiraceae bacterium]
MPPEPRPGPSSTQGPQSEPPTAARKLPDSPELSASRETRVLLVDDDAALLVALPETVRTRLGGVQVDVAESAKVALG